MQQSVHLFLISEHFSLSFCFPFSEPHILLFRRKLPNSSWSTQAHPKLFVLFLLWYAGSSSGVNIRFSCKVRRKWSVDRGSQFSPDLLSGWGSGRRFAHLLWTIWHGQWRNVAACSVRNKLWSACGVVTEGSEEIVSLWTWWVCLVGQDLMNVLTVRFF